MVRDGTIIARDLFLCRVLLKDSVHLWTTLLKIPSCALYTLAIWLTEFLYMYEYVYCWFSQLVSPQKMKEQYLSVFWDKIGYWFEIWPKLRIFKTLHNKIIRNIHIQKYKLKNLCDILDQVFFVFSGNMSAPYCRVSRHQVIVSSRNWLQATEAYPFDSTLYSELIFVTTNQISSRHHVRE